LKDLSKQSGFTVGLKRYICVYSFSTEIKVDEDYLVTWLQIVLGMIATVIIAGGVVIAAIYTR